MNSRLFLQGFVLLGLLPGCPLRAESGSEAAAPSPGTAAPAPQESVAAPQQSAAVPQQTVAAPQQAVVAPPKAARSAAERDELMKRFYRVTEVPPPEGVDPQIGALCVTHDGKIAAAFHRGEVGIWDPATQQWNIFAEGLHEPLGILGEADGSLLVMQRPELTRLRDTTGSGKADLYETVYDGFGMSGNYHEFAFGPVRAANGNLFIALNLASSGDTVRKEIRGQWLPVGMDRRDFYGDWKKTSEGAGRMYSRVPWRGWVMEVDPKTGKGTPFASGFRSPDGIAITREGRILVSDNQGDWRGSSELHVVKKGGFYGHPASLPWRADWGNRPPLEVPIAELDALRTPAAVWFPHSSYANSPTQMVQIPESPAWGPYGGQWVIGEMNVAKLLRVTLEQVNGVWQGACYPFVEMGDLKPGLHRLAFLGDSLYVGRIHLSWAGAEGIGVLDPLGGTPMDPLEIKLTKKGFRVRFTKALDATAAEPARWKIRRYTYSYGKAYGSPELNEEWIVPTEIKLSADRKSAELVLAALHEDFVYDFHFAQLVSAEGETPLNVRAAYTLRRKL